MAVVSNETRRCSVNLVLFVMLTAGLSRFSVHSAPLASMFASCSYRLLTAIEAARYETQCADRQCAQPFWIRMFENFIKG